MPEPIDLDALRSAAQDGIEIAEGCWDMAAAGVLEVLTAGVLSLLAEVERLTTQLFQWRGSASDLVREVERLRAENERLTTELHGRGFVRYERTEQGWVATFHEPDKSLWCVSCTLGEHKSCGGLYTVDGTEHECKCVHDGNEDVAGSMP